MLYKFEEGFEFGLHTELAQSKTPQLGGAWFSALLLTSAAPARFPAGAEWHMKVLYSKDLRFPAFLGQILNYFENRLVVLPITEDQF